MAERGLKLLIEDADDLAVVSAHVQDALVRVSDCRYWPARRQFVVLMNRFAWDDAAQKWRFLRPYRRMRAGLDFNDVTAVKARRLDPAHRNDVAELLAVTFEPSEMPAGTVRLVFAGGGELALSVDCLNGRLADLGHGFVTLRKPRHKGPGLV